MFNGYSSERREEFYQSGTFELLKPFIKHLVELDAKGMVDQLGHAMVEDYIKKSSKIIETLYTMVEDARHDIEAMKQANKEGRQ